jgi:hypothetical protein
MDDVGGNEGSPSHSSMELTPESYSVKLLYLPILSQHFAFLKNLYHELDARVLESVDEAADNARLPFRRQSVKIEQTPLNDSTEKNEMLGNGGNTRPRCEEIERIDLVQKTLKVSQSLPRLCLSTSGSIAYGANTGSGVLTMSLGDNRSGGISSSECAVLNLFSTTRESLCLGGETHWVAQGKFRGSPAPSERCALIGYDVNLDANLHVAR